MNAHNVHTPGNAVPPLTGTELGGLLDDLYGFDEGIDLICDGIRNIALRRLPTDRVQLLLATIAGSPDATDVVGAFGRLAERIADADNTPALRDLPLDAQKQAQRQGELTAHALTDPDLRHPASTACAALDTPPTWRCQDCDTYNAPADTACHTCGTTPARKD
jgi:hypothetical protein